MQKTNSQNKLCYNLNQKPLAFGEALHWKTFNCCKFCLLMGAVSRNLTAAPIRAPFTKVACPVTHISAYKQGEKANSHCQLRIKDYLLPGNFSVCFPLFAQSSKSRTV